LIRAGSSGLQSCFFISIC